MGRTPTEDPDEPDCVVVDVMDLPRRRAPGAEVRVTFDAVEDVEPPAQLALGSSVHDLDELQLQLVEDSATFGDITAAIEAAAMEAATRYTPPPAVEPARRVGSTMPPVNQRLVVRTDDRVGLRKR